MPRGARGTSGSGIYHVMFRGVGKEDIFLDAEDRERFLETLLRFKLRCGLEILGFCLMPNHTHLLLKVGRRETLSQSMKRIGVSYVHWFNKKYDRYGHLFQGRFRSEAVEDERYLLVVLRYIHRNPVKAGMVKKVSGYRWSSYAEYTGQAPTLTDTELVLGLFHDNREQAVAMFERFMAEENKDRCLEYREQRVRGRSDEEVRRLVRETIQSEDIREIGLISRAERNRVLQQLKARRIPIRQLARITGLGKKIIERA